MVSVRTEVVERGVVLICLEGLLYCLVGKNVLVVFALGGSRVCEKQHSGDTGKPDGCNGTAADHGSLLVLKELASAQHNRLGQSA